MVTIFPFQMNSMLASCFLLLVIHCNLLTCTEPGYILDNDVIDDVMYEPVFAEMDDQDVTLTQNKRSSTRQSLDELQALVAMVYADEENKKSVGKRETETSNVKKREWHFPLLKFSRQLSKNIFNGGQFRPATRTKVSRRRSQQLSVSGPLSALANMLAAEGRRRKQSESNSNKMRLLELGKRGHESIPAENGVGISSDDFQYH